MTARLLSQVVGAVVTLLVLVLLGAWVKSKWDDYDRLKTFEQQAIASDQATTAGLTSYQTATAGRQQVEILVSDKRASVDRRYEELKREDQTVADWSAQLIPERLRELDTAEARDGVSSAPGWREGTDDAATR